MVIVLSGCSTQLFWHLYQKFNDIHTQAGQRVSQFLPMNRQCCLVDKALGWDFEGWGYIPGSTTGLLGDLGQVA